MTPERLAADDQRLSAVLALIQRSFAYMEARIDPPSSMLNLSLSDLSEQCERGEIWIIGTPPAACVFLTPKGDDLYLGKLAVDSARRGAGLARCLVEHAVRRAKDLNLAGVELQTRVELVENHKTFAQLGFHQTRATAHPGYSRPTSLTFRRDV